MTLEQLRHQKTHRVAAEIRRQIADTQPVMLVTFGRAQPAINRRGLACNPVGPDLRLHRHAIEQRQSRQRAAVRRHLLGRQAGQLGQHGPETHALAQMYPVLDHVGLQRRRKQARAQNLLGFGQPSGLFQQPALVVDQRGPRIVALPGFRPDIQCCAQITGLLQQQA